ncbi:MAG: endonuclease/exonuclease/phosphatase family protein [Candidatus Methylomirabilales bacterium]
MKVRIGTFNAENLFARFRFKGVRERYQKPDGRRGYRYRPYSPQELQDVVKDGWTVDKTRFKPFREQNRQLTAQAMKAIKADILGLQEIEGMDTLKRFISAFLGRHGYTYKALIDGNDPRLIDVALLSTYPLAYIRTHQFERTRGGRSFVFSRDCLEVGIQLSRHTVLPVFVNHFKSMVGGRARTMARRKVQAEAVRRILQDRFGNDPGTAAWVVLGDLNDYLPSAGLEPLLGQPWVENVVGRLPEHERWTHYYDGRREYRQLDYLLLSKALARANPKAVPAIERRGMPRRATRYTGPRFDGVGQNDPKASDHCPTVIEINI